MGERKGRMNEFKITLKNGFECSSTREQKDVLPGVQSLRTKFLFCFQDYSIFLPYS